MTKLNIFPRIKLSITVKHTALSLWQEAPQSPIPDPQLELTGKLLGHRSHKYFKQSLVMQHPHPNPPHTHTHTHFRKTYLSRAVAELHPSFRRERLRGEHSLSLSRERMILSLMPHIKKYMAVIHYGIFTTAALAVYQPSTGATGRVFYITLTVKYLTTPNLALETFNQCTTINGNSALNLCGWLMAAWKRPIKWDRSAVKTDRERACTVEHGHFNRPPGDHIRYPIISPKAWVLALLPELLDLCDDAIHIKQELQRLTTVILNPAMSYRCKNSTYLQQGSLGEPKLPLCRSLRHCFCLAMVPQH